MPTTETAKSARAYIKKMIEDHRAGLTPEEKVQYEAHVTHRTQRALKKRIDALTKEISIKQAELDGLTAQFDPSLIDEETTLIDEFFENAC